MSLLLHWCENCSGEILSNFFVQTAWKQRRHIFAPMFEIFKFDPRQPPDMRGTVALVSQTATHRHPLDHWTIVR